MKKQLLISVMLVLTTMFVGCASYKQKAYVHETESVRLGQPYKKTVFTMPNRKTYTEISSMAGMIPGGGTLSITRVASREVPESHNFNEEGGLIGLDFTGEIPVKIGDSVRNYSVVELDGLGFDKFRVGSKATLVPLD